MAYAGNLLVKICPSILIPQPITVEQVVDLIKKLVGRPVLGLCGHEEVAIVICSLHHAKKEVTFGICHSQKPNVKGFLPGATVRWDFVCHAILALKSTNGDVETFNLRRVLLPVVVVNHIGRNVTIRAEEDRDPGMGQRVLPLQLPCIPRHLQQQQFSEWGEFLSGVCAIQLCLIWRL